MNEWEDNVVKRFWTKRVSIEQAIIKAYNWVEQERAELDWTKCTDPRLQLLIVWFRRGQRESKVHLWIKWNRFLSTRNRFSSNIFERIKQMDILKIRNIYLKWIVSISIYFPVSQYEDRKSSIHYNWQRMWDWEGLDAIIWGNKTDTSHCEWAGIVAPNSFQNAPTKWNRL